MWFVAHKFHCAPWNRWINCVSFSRSDPTNGYKCCLAIVAFVSEKRDELKWCCAFTIHLSRWWAHQSAWASYMCWRRYKASDWNTQLKVFNLIISFSTDLTLFLPFGWRGFFWHNHCLSIITLANAISTAQQRWKTRTSLRAFKLNIFFSTALDSIAFVCDGNSSAGIH